jgi:RHS repeat-associated protein
LTWIAALIDDNGTTHLTDYAYLGLNAFVEADYTEPDIKYTLVGTAGGDDPDTGDIYRGLDRFSRIKDLMWYNYTSAADVERTKHGYDRAGNRTYRLNPVDTNRHHDEYYWYDRIHRLDDLERGTLNSGNTGIELLEYAQCWSLDATGNWSSFREDTNGDHAWDLVQRRTSNPANEISAITTDVGALWVSPAYNRAGNMTTIPQPAAPTSTYTATYDAWNRLVKLTSGSNTVAEYQYDGAKRRVISKKYSAGVLSETRHHYYTEAWQAIEERLGSSTDAERQFVFGKRYVDDLVLRDRDANGDGSLDERLYGMQDPNWNVTAIANSSGTVQERYGYAAYGMPSFMTAAFGSRASSSYAWEQLFAGYRWDSISGLFEVRNRGYAPDLGTWIQRDPIGALSGNNLYSYCTNNPRSRSLHA